MHLSNSKWHRVIREMEGKWINVSNRNEGDSMRRAANRIGFRASRKRLPTGQFRVWIYKAGERIPERRGRQVGDIQNVLGGRTIGSVSRLGNWDVDIYNLPIPKSAYRKAA